MSISQDVVFMTAQRRTEDNSIVLVSWWLSGRVTEQQFHPTGPLGILLPSIPHQLPAETVWSEEEFYEQQYITEKPQD